LQEPIRSIQIFSSKLKKSTCIKPESSEEISLYYIQEGAANMRRMIRAITDHSFAYREQYRYDEFSVVALIKEVKDSLINEYPLNKILIHFNGSDIVKLPKHQLRIIFKRIVENSIQFNKNEEDYDITFNMSIHSTGYYFEIIDKNAEFSEELIEWLKGKQEKYSLHGLGFGMMVASEIIRDLRGRLNIIEQNGKGVKLILFIPHMIQEKQ